MNTLKITLLTLLFTFSYVMVKAEDVPQTISLKLVTTTNQRPHAPGNDFIECYYNDGLISFSLPEDSGYISVSIIDENSGSQSSAVIYDNSDTLMLPSEGSSFIIICDTDSNKKYIGELLI